jgi:hypothetical protein
MSYREVAVAVAALLLCVGGPIEQAYAYHPEKGEGGTYVTRHAAGGFVRLGATVAVRQAIGKETLYRVHTHSTRLGDAPVLELVGMRDWTIKTIGRATGEQEVGTCGRMDEDAAVFLAPRQLNGHPLLLVTGTNCMATLRVVPRREGRFFLRIKVFTHRTMDSKGRGLDMSDWTHLDPGTEVRKAELRFQIAVVR